MTDDATWTRVVALRTELIDQLAALPAERWDEPSLCSGWRIRDVVAHTILPERFSGLRGFIGLARAGFSLRRYVHNDAVTRGSAPLDALIGSYRDAIGRRTTPPGRTPQHLLDDLFIHTQDVRRPLALHAPPVSLSHDPGALTAIAQAVATDGGLGAPKRIAGLRLTATDIHWITGDGDEVTGPAEALILAMSGRDIVIPELEGPGVAILAARL